MPHARSAISSFSADIFPKTSKHRGEEAPRDGEGERERQDVGDETEDQFERRIVVHEQLEELLEDIAEHEHDAQDGDGKERSHQHLSEDVTIEDFHGLRMVCARLTNGKAADERGAAGSSLEVAKRGLSNGSFLRFHGAAAGLCRESRAWHGQRRQTNCATLRSTRGPATAAWPRRRIFHRRAEGKAREEISAVTSSSRRVRAGAGARERSRRGGDCRRG